MTDVASGLLRLVMATRNEKKRLELQALLAELPVQLVAQSDLGIAEAEEPHLSFIENALAKARHAAVHACGPAIADDSGLCVDALGGAPGVQSAHFAPLVLPALGRETQRAAQDAANNIHLLRRLQGVADRRARFVSTLVAVRRADDPEPLVAVGRWEGHILHAAMGRGGFGYDPLLFIADLGCAVAELPAALKNQHSHRGLAAAHMRGLMREAWRLG